jgi:hypothetical protein
MFELVSGLQTLLYVDDYIYYIDYVNFINYQLVFDSHNCTNQ